MVSLRIVLPLWTAVVCTVVFYLQPSSALKDSQIIVAEPLPALRNKRSPIFKKLWHKRGDQHYYQSYHPNYPYGHGQGGPWRNHQQSGGHSSANAQAISGHFGVGDLHATFSGASASASSGSSNHIGYS